MEWEYLPFAIQTVAASVIGIWLLFRWNTILEFIPYYGLRKRVKIILVTCCFYAAFQPANYGWYKMSRGVDPYLLWAGYPYICVLALLTSYAYSLLTSINVYKRLPRSRQMITAFVVITLTPILAEIAISPLSGFKGIALAENLSFTLWAGCFAAILLLFFENYSTRQTILLQQKELELVKLNQLNTQVRLESLQAKVNPHFLHNALNALAGLALENGTKASEMAVALSRMLRYNLNKEQNSLVTVQEEVETTMDYLQVEKIRFEERLQFSFQVSGPARDFLIPRFTLQPMVENCIKHGAGAGQLYIETSITDEASAVTIRIMDNGKPFTEGFVPGFGLQSLYDKMQLHFPGRHHIELCNQPKEIVIKMYGNATVL